MSFWLELTHKIEAVAARVSNLEQAARQEEVKPTEEFWKVGDTLVDSKGRELVITMCMRPCVRFAAKKYGDAVGYKDEVYVDDHLWITRDELDSFGLRDFH